MQMQAQTNIQTQQASAQLEVQKEQAKSQSSAMLENMKGQMDAQKMLQENELKKEIMSLQFQYDMELKQLEMQINQTKEGTKEDRKDQRTKIQASQQSQMIDQRSNDRPPKDFESEGKNKLNIDQFNPVRAGAPIAPGGGDAPVTSVGEGEPNIEQSTEPEGRGEPI